MQPAIDFDNVGIPFQVFSKAVMLETPALEERLLLKCFIPKNGFKFPIVQGGFQHIAIDQPDSFTGFFLGEILALKGQNVVEQGLVPPVTFPKVPEVNICFYRDQPLGKVLNFIFRPVILNRAILIHIL